MECLSIKLLQILLKFKNKVVFQKTIVRKCFLPLLDSCFYNTNPKNIANVL